MRQLLSRIEDEKTGKILVDDLFCEIPAQRIQQAQDAARNLEKHFVAGFPFVNNAKPVSNNSSELILNRAWRPALSITGIGCIPPIANAGNVKRPKTQVKLSMRLPPLISAETATQKLKQILEQDPPYNANVSFEPDQSVIGWNAPVMDERLIKTVNESSETFYAKPVQFCGEGGTIPFMAMLGEKFPKAQFMITGIVGPKSNAHGSNEFLHIPMAKKLTACVSYVIVNY